MIFWKVQCSLTVCTKIGNHFIYYFSSSSSKYQNFWTCSIRPILMIRVSLEWPWCLCSESLSITEPPTLHFGVATNSFARGQNFNVFFRVTIQDISNRYSHDLNWLSGLKDIQEKFLFWCIFSISLYSFTFTHWLRANLLKICYDLVCTAVYLMHYDLPVWWWHFPCVFLVNQSFPVMQNHNYMRNFEKITISMCTNHNNNNKIMVLRHNYNFRSEFW